LAKIALLLLKLFGWQIVGELPKEKKYVVIFAPHTSNWDFVIFLLVKIVFKLKLVFIGKHTLFIGPLGWLLRKLGGLPIERSSRHDMVDFIVSEFKQSDEMIFGLSPEGTRKYLDHWKSGFYHIAYKANIPVLCAFLDHSKKQSGFGPLFYLSKDKYFDLEKISKFYSDKIGMKPENFSKSVFK